MDETTKRFEALIRYGADGCGCFNPQKVVGLACIAFPGTEVDPTDHSAREVEQIEAILAGGDASEDTRETVRRQIRGKAARNGPTYRLSVRLPSGVRAATVVARYHVTLRPDGSLSEQDRSAVEAFLRSLRLGEIEYEGLPP